MYSTLSSLLPSILSYSLIFLSLSPSSTTWALRVTPGSLCASLCASPNEPTAQTNTSDIVCADSAYSDTDEGERYRECIECLVKSDATDEAESDLEWLLYNLRYAVGTCLFAFGGGNHTGAEKQDAPALSCSGESSCLPLQDLVLFDDLDPSKAEDSLGYCSRDGSSFDEDRVQPCRQCLRGTGSQTYLSNFIVTLQAACEQQPTTGTILALGDDIFSNTPLTIVQTSPSPSSTAAPGQEAASDDTSGIIIGISIGGAFTVAAAILFVIRYYRWLNRPSSPGSSDGPPSVPTDSPDPGKGQVTISKPWIIVTSSPEVRESPMFFSPPRPLPLPSKPPPIMIKDNSALPAPAPPSVSVSEETAVSMGTKDSKKSRPSAPVIHPWDITAAGREATLPRHSAYRPEIRTSSSTPRTGASISPRPSTVWSSALTEFEEEDQLYNTYSYLAPQGDPDDFVQKLSPPSQPTLRPGTAISTESRTQEWVRFMREDAEVEEQRSRQSLNSNSGRSRGRSRRRRGTTTSQDEGLSLPDSLPIPPPPPLPVYHRETHAVKPKNPVAPVQKSKLLQMPIPPMPPIPPLPSMPSMSHVLQTAKNEPVSDRRPSIRNRRIKDSEEPPSDLFITSPLNVNTSPRFRDVPLMGGVVMADGPRPDVDAMTDRSLGTATSEYWG